MLALTEMLVVFMLTKKITLGIFKNITAEFSPLKKGYEFYKSATETR